MSTKYDSFAPDPDLTTVDAPSAVVGFVGGWLGAQVLASLVLAVLGQSGTADTPITVLSIALIVGWAVEVAAIWIVSRRAGTADPTVDFGITFRPIDLVGLAAGVAAQLVVVRLVYLPLTAWWPEMFSDEALTRNAEDLVGRASGATTVLLIVVVALGAPLVEELFYRGLLQRPLLARFNQAAVVVGVAAVFALVHFRPVEYPGLFVFGILVGVVAWRTQRLGGAITMHIGFNLTGLLMVL